MVREMSTHNIPIDCNSNLSYFSWTQWECQRFIFSTYTHPLLQNNTVVLQIYIMFHRCIHPLYEEKEGTPFDPGACHHVSQVNTSTCAWCLQRGNVCIRTPMSIGMFSAYCTIKLEQHFLISSAWHGYSTQKVCNVYREREFEVITCYVFLHDCKGSLHILYCKIRIEVITCFAFLCDFKCTPCLTQHSNCLLF